MSLRLGLLHGFGATAFTWRKVVEPLRAAHTVVVLDRPWAPFDEPCLVLVGATDRWATPVPVRHARTVVLDRCGPPPAGGGARTHGTRDPLIVDALQLRRGPEDR